MDCPKCEGELIDKTVESTVVFRCDQCFGLWVSPSSIRQLLNNWDPDKDFDTGSESIGKKFDKIGDIDCPTCKFRMDKLEDELQPHIWMECCSGCGFTFFDAGELTDLKSKTFSDKFKGLLKGKRK
jgi:Zn-finger nucleic acid-binding protein